MDADDSRLPMSSYDDEGFQNATQCLPLTSAYVLLQIALSLFRALLCRAVASMSYIHCG